MITQPGSLNEFPPCLFVVGPSHKLYPYYGIIHFVYPKILHTPFLSNALGTLHLLNLNIVINQICCSHLLKQGIITPFARIDLSHAMSKQKILPVQPLIHCKAGRAKTKPLIPYGLQNGRRVIKVYCLPFFSLFILYVAFHIIHFVSPPPKLCINHCFQIQLQ